METGNQPSKAILPNNAFARDCIEGFKILMYKHKILLLEKLLGHKENAVQLQLMEYPVSKPDALIQPARL